MGFRTCVVRNVLALDRPLRNNFLLCIFVACTLLILRMTVCQQDEASIKKIANLAQLAYRFLELLGWSLNDELKKCYDPFYLFCNIYDSVV